MHIVVVFPGQGSQKTGMPVHSLIGSFPSVDNKTKLIDLINSEDGTSLQLTANAQPAIVASSYYYWEKLKALFTRTHTKTNVVLGHSLGEYSALVAANVLSFQDALELTRKRGMAMQEAVPVGVGGMLAVLKTPVEKIEALCSEVSTPDSLIEIANYNLPGQIVLSGHLLAIEKIKEKIKEIGGRAILLKVSAPFHSSLMTKAKRSLEQSMREVKFKTNTTSYVPNVNAQVFKPGTDVKVITHHLLEQLDSSVLWYQSLKEVVKENSIIIECGPGVVLKNIAKKLLPDTPVFALSDPNDFKLLEEKLQ